MLGMIETVAANTPAPPPGSQAGSYGKSDKGHFRGMLKDAMDHTASPRIRGNLGRTKKPPTDTPADSGTAADMATDAAAMTAALPAQPPPDTAPATGTAAEELVQPLSGISPLLGADTVDTTLFMLPLPPTDLSPDMVNRFGASMTTEENAAYIAATNNGETTAPPPPAQEKLPAAETLAASPAAPPADTPPDTAAAQTILRETTATTQAPAANSIVTAPAQTDIAAPPQKDSPLMADGDEDTAVVRVQSATTPPAAIDEIAPAAEKPLPLPANRLATPAPETQNTASTLGGKLEQAAQQLADLRMAKGHAAPTVPDSKPAAEASTAADTAASKQTSTAANPAASTVTSTAPRTTTNTVTSTAANTAASTTANAANNTTPPAETATAAPVTETTRPEPLPHEEPQADRAAQPTQTDTEEPPTAAAVTDMNASPLRTSFSDAVGQILDRQSTAETSPAAQIETEILANLENQKTEFRMQLEPAALGKIDVRMVLESGKLVVEIVSAAKTNEMLARQADSLAAALRLDNPDLTSVQVVTETSQSGTAYLENALHGGDAYAGQQNSESRHMANQVPQSQRQSETDDLGHTDTLLRLGILSRTLDYSI